MVFGFPMMAFLFPFVAFRLDMVVFDLPVMNQMLMFVMEMMILVFPLVAFLLKSMISVLKIVQMMFGSIKFFDILNMMFFFFSFVNFPFLDPNFKLVASGLDINQNCKRDFLLCGA